MANNNKQSMVALALITAVCLAGDSMLYIVLPVHWRAVGLSSLVEVGVLLSINRFVRLPLNPIIGFIFTKINFRTGILLAVLISGFVTFSYGIVNDFSFWIFLRSLWGLGWSIFKLGAYLLIIQPSSTDNRGGFMGTYNGLYRLGSLFGMLIGGFFADLFGIKIVSIVLGLLTFATIPFIFKYIPLKIQIEEEHKKRDKSVSSIHFIKNRTLLWMLINGFLTVTLLDGMFNATLSHFIDIRYTNKFDIQGFLLEAATIAGGIQAVRWGLVPIISVRIGSKLDKINRKSQMLALFLAVASVLFVAISFKLSLVIWLPLLLLLLLVASVLTTIIDTIVSEIAANTLNKVLIMTVYTIVIDLGAALGPLLGYLLGEKIGFTRLFLGCALISLMLSIKSFLPTGKKGKGKIANT